MNTAILILARMGSSRAPRKMLAEIAGRPLLERLIDRLKEEREEQSPLMLEFRYGVPSVEAQGLAAGSASLSFEKRLVHELTKSDGAGFLRARSIS